MPLFLTPVYAEAPTTLDWNQIKLAPAPSGVECNCYAFVAQTHDLPWMAEIQPNTTPSVGAVAIFIYSEKGTGMPVKHIAIIVAVKETGFVIKECNFHRCHCGERFISYSDPHIVGFWRI